LRWAKKGLVELGDIPPFYFFDGFWSLKLTISKQAKRIMTEDIKRRQPMKLKLKCSSLLQPPSQKAVPMTPMKLMPPQKPSSSQSVRPPPVRQQFRKADFANHDLEDAPSRRIVMPRPLVYASDSDDDEKCRPAIKTRASKTATASKENKVPSKPEGGESTSGFRRSTRKKVGT